MMMKVDGKEKGKNKILETWVWSFGFEAYKRFDLVLNYDCLSAASSKLNNFKALIFGVVKAT